MAILNYTTKIDAYQTVGEIQAILARNGVDAIHIMYQDGEPIAVTFTIQVAGNMVNFRLPSRWQGVLSQLKKDKVSKALCTESQAKRGAWRIIKSWVESQLAFVAAGVAELPEVFLPYMVSPATEKTLYETMIDNKFLLTDNDTAREKAGKFLRR